MTHSPFDTVTPERGFLPSFDPCSRLEVSGAEAWESALAQLPQLRVASGNDALRSFLRALPVFPTDAVLQVGATDQSQLWRAYLLLSFLSHSYMWCEDGPTPQILPARLAQPWVAVAAALDMPPVLVYATYNLYNWRKIDPAGPIALGNICCLHNFFGGQDEEWFRLVHVQIEVACASAVAGLPAMQAAAQAGDAPRVQAGCEAIRAALAEAQRVLARMEEKCDPYIYYHRVRQPMSGWRNNPLLPNGLIYEGVSDTPMQLYGETGAQSSIVAAFDAALGITHDSVWLRDYLDGMQAHMPPTHRAFIAAVAGPHVRSMCGASSAPAAPTGLAHGGADASAGGVGTGAHGVVSGGGGATGGALRGAYNGAVGELERFRAQHRAFAYSYIAKFSKAAVGGDKGTGGSDFMPALQGYRETTAGHRL
ncbi:MAG: hypothetical protein WDW38_011573 [Sanguina aurantia]